jgi:hypothetical protein
MAMARQRIKAGDKVLVRGYPADVVAEVLEVYGPKGHRNALVLRPIPGPDGEVLDTVTISYPLDKVRLADVDAA